MVYFVYILQSLKDGSYYVGSTQDLDSRLERHNQGRSKYTKAKKPWELVFREEHPDRSSTIKRESEIKRRKSSQFIESLVSTSRMAMREGREFESRRPRHRT
ncbi:MAG: GIY-YIG nuclease family protein [Desulfobacteria bacterium]